MQPLKFRNGYVISSHTLLTMWLLIYAGIKVSEKGYKVDSNMLGDCFLESDKFFKVTRFGRV